MDMAMDNGHGHGQGQGQEQEQELEEQEQELEEQKQELEEQEQELEKQEQKQADRFFWFNIYNDVDLLLLLTHCLLQDTHKWDEQCVHFVQGCLPGADPGF